MIEFITKSQERYDGYWANTKKVRIMFGQDRKMPWQGRQYNAKVNFSHVLLRTV